MLTYIRNCSLAGYACTCIWHIYLLLIFSIKLSQRMCCDKTCYDKSWYVIQWLRRYKKETGSIFFYLKKESECVKNNLHIMNRKKVGNTGSQLPSGGMCDKTRVTPPHRNSISKAWSFRYVWVSLCTIKQKERKLN